MYVCLILLPLQHGDHYHHHQLDHYYSFLTIIPETSSSSSSSSSPPLPPPHHNHHHHHHHRHHHHHHHHHQDNHSHHTITEALARFLDPTIPAFRIDVGTSEEQSVLVTSDVHQQRQTIEPLPQDVAVTAAKLSPVVAAVREAALLLQVLACRHYKSR